MRHLVFTLGLIAATSTLVGCDALGIETATQVNAKREAEARAIGSACRHALRGIEDCFASNAKAGKAAVFEGWKEMDQYMRDNQLVGLPAGGEAAKPDSEATVAPAGEGTEAKSRRS